MIHEKFPIYIDFRKRSQLSNGLIRNCWVSKTIDEKLVEQLW